MESSSPGRENDGVNNFDTLDALAAAAKHWRCKLLFNQAERSETETDEDFDADPVDLCAFLQPTHQKKKNLALPCKTNYMFPERFKGRAAIPLLRTELKVAAIKCGHNLSVRTSKKPSGTTDREYQITFCCDHARLVGKGPTKTSQTDSSTDKEPTTAKKKDTRAYKSSTKRSETKDKQCQFHFCVFLHQESASRFPSRWFLSTLPVSGIGSHNEHQHHFQLDPSHMHFPIDCMTSQEKKLATNCSQVNFTSSSTSDLLNVRQKDGLYFKASQLTYLGQKERRALSNLSSDASSAEELVSSFDAR
jgi:hypothetical protein